MMALKLFKHPTATVVGDILDWLGILIAPMINDALSLRWVLPTYLAVMAFTTLMVSIYSLGTLCFGTNIVLVDPTPEHRRLDAFLLLMAERLQHVEATKDERCVVCHALESIGPVRLSCQHLFCCKCAHITFVRRDTCPLCLQRPSPTKISLQNPNIIKDMDGRVKEIYPYCFPQLASASHIAILAAYWED
jgi:hypothetical protein